MLPSPYNRGQHRSLLLVEEEVHSVTESCNFTDLCWFLNLQRYAHKALVNYFKRVLIVLFLDILNLVWNTHICFTPWTIKKPFLSMLSQCNLNSVVRRRWWKKYNFPTSYILFGSVTFLHVRLPQVLFPLRNCIYSEITFSVDYDLIQCTG